MIFSNPALPETTVAVLDGGANTSGDTATFSFASPLNPTAPGFSAEMAVGSGFSFQGVSGHACGGGQVSEIKVNDQQLTSCAGNFDDGEGNNGALITVGGVGDSLDNPTPPDAPPTDDELYSLKPFLKTGDTELKLNTVNPDGTDNLFLAVISITAEARVTTEICDNGVDDDGDGLVDGDDPDCAPPAQTAAVLGRRGQRLRRQGRPSERPRLLLAQRRRRDRSGASAPEAVLGRQGQRPRRQGRLPRDPGCSSRSDDNESNPRPAKRCTITGTAGNDVIRGTSGSDVICAGSGNDVVYGRGGNDVIYGGSGNDVLRGGDGSDRVNGGSGQDVLRGGDGNDRLTGGPGNDALHGDGGADSLNTQDARRGNDVARGGAGDDSCATDPRDVRSSC